MSLILRLFRGIVSAAIFALLGIGFLPREAANRLVLLQNFLTKEIERRDAA